MPLIKIPRHYLVSQDEDSITVDVPESMLLHWKKDYEKIIQAKGILKHKKSSNVSSFRYSTSGMGRMKYLYDNIKLSFPMQLSQLQQ